MYGNIVYNVLSLLQGLESELEGMKENYLKRFWKKNSTQTKLLDREKAIHAELDSWHVCPPNTVLIDALLTVYKIRLKSQSIQILQSEQYSSVIGTRESKGQKLISAMYVID